MRFMKKAAMAAMTPPILAILVFASCDTGEEDRPTVSVSNGDLVFEPGQPGDGEGGCLPGACNSAQVCVAGVCVDATTCTTDTDGDGVMDCTDVCEGFADSDDSDSDGIPDGCDDCVLGDTDSDGTCDDDDPCVGVDSDGDGVCDDIDECAGFNDGMDTDGDGTPDDCDDCVLGDTDSDGTCDDDDPCVGVDSDGDGVCDSVDRCAGFDDSLDEDGDGIPNDCDTCVLGDEDGDTVCDDFDPCVGNDEDGDNVCDDIDEDEICNNGLDDDGDGYVDVSDSPECDAQEVARLSVFNGAVTSAPLIVSSDVESRELFLPGDYTQPIVVQGTDKFLKLWIRTTAVGFQSGDTFSVCADGVEPEVTPAGGCLTVEPDAGAFRATTGAAKWYYAEIWGATGTP